MKAFLSYSHKDASQLERLHTHLAILRREEKIDAWFDREILAGSDLKEEIDQQLEECDLFLLLVSPDFLDSDYCYEREMTRALERHEAGEARVVPIIVEPCDWGATALGKLKALPRDAKPVSDWTNRNNAYLDIVQELRRIIEDDKNRQATNAPSAGTAAPSSPTKRYRVKRDFDQIDLSDFRTEAFERIRSYFESAIAEIDGIEELRGRFTSIGPYSFGSTLINKAKDRSTAHITVHVQTDSYGFGDIYFSYSENAPTDTAHGALNIEAGEYDLYLISGFGGSDEKFTPHDAAEWLWNEFLGQAGVSYD